MPPPRGSRGPFAPAVALLAAGALLVVAAGSGGAGRETAAGGSAGWTGLAGGVRSPVAVGQRMIVVLEAPSVADRLSAAGGHASEADERRWAATAFASQKLLISSLGVQGVSIQAEHSYGRVLNGFSAPLDARAVTALERSDEVEGVYPVRAAYPASVASSDLRRSLSGSVAEPSLALPGFDGRGVTIALLDTGVDRSHRYLSGRLEAVIDILGGSTTNPDNPGEVERHGTHMAGILVGAGGPYGLSGVATGATVLPIRVAGWQRDASQRFAVFSRTDQLLAGLERAVDPNDDGDAHDAARVALVALAEPFAAFVDGPLARAVRGASRLDTLVVTAAGNDGGAGASFGKISGPGGAPAALTVGALDLRPRAASVRLVARAGLRVVVDRVVPLVGAVTPRPGLDVAVGFPRARQSRTAARLVAQSLSLTDMFDRAGFSSVAGRAAILPAGDDPGGSSLAAARAGARAVLLYGERLPQGGLGLDARVGVPVAWIPTVAARRLSAAAARGVRTRIALGETLTRANSGVRHVALFSSRGLAFDGRVKPELVAPGVGIPTADAAAGRGGYATVNGSSAAAAEVAGAAAVLAQARPALTAGALKGLLVGSARRTGADPVAAQGAGSVDVGAAAAAEVMAQPASLAFSRAWHRNWRERHSLLVRNVSTRPLRVELRVERRGFPAAAVRLSLPDALELRPGQAARVPLSALVARPPRRSAPAQGAILLRPDGGSTVRVPWVISFRRPVGGLVGALRLQPTDRFKPSDTAPVVLTLRAGRVVRAPDGDEVQPVRRLDVELWRVGGRRLGTLARLRDLLPGNYAFGLTGRDPAGRRLARGRYRLRLLAFPTQPGGPTRAAIPFTIR